MISTHILDTSVGSPAADVKVDLFKVNGEVEDLLDSNKTNTDGRIKFNCAAESGKYKLVFHIEQYYKEKNVDHFFSNVPVCFKIKDTDRNYHVPLLLNPFGHSTYRGS